MDGTVSLLHLSTERGVSVDTRANYGLYVALRSVFPPLVRISVATLSFVGRVIRCVALYICGSN